MKGRRFGVAALVAVTLVLLGAGAGSSAPAGDVWLAEISPLTGPLSFVGVDNRQGVDVAVKEINRRGGIKGRRVRVQVFDDGSNPSQAVGHMNTIAGDKKWRRSSRARRSRTSRWRRRSRRCSRRSRTTS